ncbi:MAG TPA: ferritin-like domain-containing protein [Solirubrobacteraceae bacterium]|nr:ferritin-like domain-containing protein [Solirubrobacteraceae bacterium]
MSGLTRRAALAAALAAAVARPGPAAAAAKGDAAVLTDLLRIEHAAAFAYGAAVSSGSARARAVARAFAAQEAEHVAALETALEALGAPKPPPPASAEQVDALARELEIAPVLGELRSGRDVLTFLLALEDALVARWAGAHRRLQDGRLLQTATSILACQAQHAVVLREALGRDPLGR